MPVGRNKYPEETVRKILDTAERLFVEKGYDRASLQDIIRATGLSKGAIYHHFASKEDIFYAVCDRIGQRNAAVLSQVRDDASISAYGLFQRVRLQSGEAPAELLRGRTLSARIGLLGDLAFQCGGTAEAGDADLFRAWGLTGRYAVTAVEHRWEKGLFTTSLSLEA